MGKNVTMQIIQRLTFYFIVIDKINRVDFFSVKKNNIHTICLCYDCPSQITNSNPKYIHSDMQDRINVNKKQSECFGLSY